MTLDAPRRQTLLKTLRGKSFRRAMKAIAELRAGDDPTLVDALGADQTVDAQRGVQHHIARIVVAHGVRGLVREWPLRLTRSGAPNSSSRSSRLSICGSTKPPST